MLQQIEIFPWNKNLETGIAEIDAQHQQLVHLINRLAAHITNQSDTLTLGEIIKELSDYVTFHFRTEEAIMHGALADDEWEAEHLQTHHSFEKEIAELKLEGHDKPLPEVIAEVLSFLTHWLAFHILESDKRMTKVVLAMRQGMSLEEAKAHAETEMTGSMKVLIETVLHMYDSLSSRTLQLMHEVFERQKAENKLRLAGSVIENSLEAIFITDADGIIVDVNPSFLSITECSHEAVVGQSIHSMHLGLDKSSPIWHAVREEGHWVGEIWNRSREGEATAEWLTLSAIKDDEGGLSHYVGLFANVSQLVERQQKLEHMANHDPLTGLPNRLLMMDRLLQAVAGVQRHPDTVLGVCFMDLDGFKQVNDTLGHDAGDSLLKVIAQRLKHCLRATDTVCRVGGDEFIILLPDLKHANDCLPTLQRLLQIVAEPVPLGDQQARVSLSMGVAIYPTDSSDTEEILLHADKAMYQAKSSGKNRYVLWKTESAALA